MAKLRIFEGIENGVYFIRFENDLTALSENDKLLMEKYGEPEINVGGTFDWTVGQDSGTFTFPDQFLKVRQDFPYRRDFDSKDTAFAEHTKEIVDVYQADIVAKFTAAFVALRANADLHTGETVVNV